MRYQAAGTALVLSAAMLLGFAGSSQAEVKLAAKTAIVGKVVDDEGKAVAEAMVRVLPAPLKGEKREKNLADGDPEKPAKPEIKRKPKPVAEGKTNADGTFSLEVPAGTYIVRANQKGHGAGMTRVTVAEGAQSEVEIKLSERGAGKKKDQ